LLGLDDDVGAWAVWLSIEGSADIIPRADDHRQSSWLKLARGV